MITVEIPFRNLTRKIDFSPSIQIVFQTEYDRAFIEFMSTSPPCPHCSAKLYRHDRCLRSFYFGAEKVSISIRRVRCPRCGKVHRILPSFIVPGFQICSMDADRLVLLAVSHSPFTGDFVESMISFSSAYRFLRKIRTRFHHVLHRLTSFASLFTFSADRQKHYRCLFPDFGPFLLFQPNA